MDSWLRSPPPDQIDAGSVRLRRWRPEDAEALTRLVSDNLEHLRGWMPWAQQQPTLDSQRAFISRMQKEWEDFTNFGYAITLPTGELIGGIGLHTRQGMGTLEIGYWIAEPHTRRGYATAASRVLAQTGLAFTGVEAVEIRCDEGNGASVAIPRRLGFRLVSRNVGGEIQAPAETGRWMVWAARRGEWPPIAAGRQSP